MARDPKLLQVSRIAVEPYVNSVISKRKSVKDVRLSTKYEDTTLKIDGFVTATSGKIIPIQVKTRKIKSNNFSITKTELANVENLKVFCFVDKTFDDPTLDYLISAGENAVEVLEEEGIKIYGINQPELQNLADDDRLIDKGEYYLVSKYYLHLLN